MPNPDFRRGFPSDEFEKQKRFGYCAMCRANRHTRCDRHANDGAVDALEFTPVSCICPCEGDVREGFRLIDLVADLRQQITEIAVKLNEERGDRANAEERLITLAEFVFDELDDALFDEEGRFNPSPGAKGVFCQLRGIFLDSEIQSLKELFASDDERYNEGYVR